jgi:hypothetical protein
VFVTIAHIPAIPADQPPQSAQLASLDSTLSDQPALLPAHLELTPSMEFANAPLDTSTPTNASLHAQLDTDQSADSALNALRTVLHAMETLTPAPAVSVDTLLTLSLEFVKLPQPANSDNTSPNHPTHAQESALKTLSTMNQSALLLASKATKITELEVALPPAHKADAHILTISAMESASATAPLQPMLIQAAEFANHAHPTASHA